MGSGGGSPAGSARLVLAAGAVPLHPEVQTFEAMLTGWEALQSGPIDQERQRISGPVGPFRVKRVSRAKDAPWRPLQEAAGASPKATQPALRSGLVIHAKDLDMTRHFFEEVIGLKVTRQTKSVTVFAGWLAIESRTEVGGQMQMSIGEPSPASISLYVEGDEYNQLRHRFNREGVAFTQIDTDRGPSLRTADPNGVRVEIRLVRSGGRDS